MTLSDAQPVQFWPTGCNTYNESLIKGVHHSCFCQPFDCDDEIKVQFVSSAHSGYSLVIIDEDDIDIETIPFVEILNDTWEISFTPSELDPQICDQVVRLEIRANTTAVMAKSDCIEIRSEFADPTYLITYSNHRNLAGLIYENVSPADEFYLRVPARFFHEKHLQTDEAIELTSSITTTASQVKRQRLLEVCHAPYYFHWKLQLVLMHATIEIDGYEWEKETAYEIPEGNKRWPKKPATVYLTEKNSVRRNVL